VVAGSAAAAGVEVAVNCSSSDQTRQDEAVAGRRGLIRLVVGAGHDSRVGRVHLVAAMDRLLEHLLQLPVQALDFPPVLAREIPATKTEHLEIKADVCKDGPACQVACSVSARGAEEWQWSSDHSLAAGDPEVAAGARSEPLQLLDEAEDALAEVVAGVELGACDDVTGEPRHVRAHLHLVPPVPRRRLPQSSRRLPRALRHVRHPAPQPVRHERRRAHVAPFAISRPRPMKCFAPCRCSHDLPFARACRDDRSSRTIPASVTHTRGSLPYQYTNSFPAAPPGQLRRSRRRQ
jgi:hypothetical protein